MTVTFTDNGNASDTGTNQTSLTFTGFGAEAADRIVVIHVAVNDALSSYSATGATLSGLTTASGAVTIFQTPAGINSKALIIVAHVPTDAGGFVCLIDWSEAITSDQLGTAISYYGANANIADITAAYQLLIDDSTNDTVISGTIDCPAGGVVTAAASMAGAVSISSWSLGTTDNHQLSADSAVRLGVAHHIYATAQDNVTVSATASANTAVKSLAAIAIGPGSSAQVTVPVANIDVAGLAPYVYVYAPGPNSTVDGPLGGAAMGVNAMGGDQDLGTEGAVTVPVANIAVAALAPTVVGNQSGAVTVPAANIAVAALAPTVVGNQSGAVTVPVANIDVAGLAPTVQGDSAAQVTVPVANIAVAALAPAVLATSSGAVTVPVANIDVAALAPTVVGFQSANVAPPAADIAVAALAPTVVGNQTASVTVPVSEIVITALAPTVLPEVTVRPVPANIDVSALAPTVVGVQDANVSVPSATISISALAPTSSISASGLVQPLPANINVSARAPIVTVGTGGITGQVVAQLLSPTVFPILLFEGEFNSGFLRLWSGYGDLLWDDKTWSGAGTLIGVSTIQDTTDIRATGVTVDLSGISTTAIAVALAEARQGKQGTIWLGFLDGVNVIDDPVILFRGKLDVPEIEDGGDTCRIAITYESRLIDLERPRERRYTPEDQAMDYPGDHGFDEISKLQDKKIVWGYPIK